MDPKIFFSQIADRKRGKGGINPYGQPDRNLDLFYAFPKLFLGGFWSKNAIF